MPKKIPIEKKLEAKVGPEVCRDLMAFAERTGLTIEDVAAVLLAGPQRQLPVDKESVLTDEEDDQTGGLRRLQGKRFKKPSDHRRDNDIAGQNAIYEIKFARDNFPFGRLFIPENPTNTFKIYHLSLIRPRRNPNKFILSYRIPPSKDILEYSWWINNWKNLRTSYLKVTEFLKVKEGKPIEVVDMKRFTLNLKPSSTVTNESTDGLAPFIPEHSFDEMYKRDDLHDFFRKEARKIAKNDTDAVLDLEQEAWWHLAKVGSDDIEQCKREALKAMDAARKRNNFLSHGDISLDDLLT